MGDTTSDNSCMLYVVFASEFYKVLGL